MGEEKIYFMEGNHPGVVYYGPRSALESRQRRDGGLWIAAPSPTDPDYFGEHEVIREVDAEGWLIDE